VADDDAAAPSEPRERAAVPFQVEVVRSTRRRRTVGAQLRGGVLRVSVPSWMSKADEAAWVEEMARRFSRKVSTDGVDLAARAAALAARHRLPAPATISWVDMSTRWGSCTPANRSIRISNRLAPFPSWVLDYVIVHELAHLSVPDHSRAFWALVERYPKAERARGFLVAKSGDDENDAD
jgi:predicted metal-dependent hydrolase